MKWKKPPPAGKGAWLQRLEPLKRRPGEWALVHETPRAQTAYNMRSELASRRYRVPEGDWDFQARANDGRGEVYAKYLGPITNEPAPVGAAG